MVEAIQEKFLSIGADLQQRWIERNPLVFWRLWT
jgi:hypothetical protein